MNVVILLLHQALEHFAHHAEMVLCSLELPLQVDKVGRRGVEPLREKSAMLKPISGCDRRKSSALSNT